VDDQLGALPGSVTAVPGLGDQRVVVFAGLDIQTYPVDQWQQGLQFAWVDAGAVQADLEAHGAYLFDGLGQGRLKGRLATGKHQRIQQPTTAVHEIDDLLPGDFRVAPCRQQLGIMAVQAAPGAALSEDHRCQFPLWVNPDCGLKTRAWRETREALANMVAAARELRAAG